MCHEGAGARPSAKRMVQNVNKRHVHAAWNEGAGARPSTKLMVQNLSKRHVHAACIEGAGARPSAKLMATSARASKVCVRLHEYGVQSRMRPLVDRRSGPCMPNL